MSSTAEPFRLSVFVPPVVAVVADHLGALADAGVDLIVSRTNSSAQQLTELRAGDVDAVVTAMDNVIEWTSSGCRTVVVAQLEATTALSLVARPSIDDVGALAGAAIGVDAFANGFSMLVRHLIRARAVPDVRWVEAGGVRERFAALEGGTVDATLLGSPFTEAARAAGFRDLGRVDSLFADFPGQGLVVAAERMPELAPVLTRLLRAFDRAVSWSADADQETGCDLLTDAGYPGPAARSAWDCRPRTLVPAAAGRERIERMRRDLGLLPVGIEAAELWAPGLVVAATHPGSSEPVENRS